MGQKIPEGGVSVYQRNLIDYLTQYTNHDIYFLSSGFKYTPFRTNAFIRRTKNAYEKRGNCHSFEIVNSPIIAPAWATCKNPQRVNNDVETFKLFSDFCSLHGPFDVVHFNNLEGISVNVLEFKRKYPQTKIIVSVHNYQMICPLAQFFQFKNHVICNDFKRGTECIKCSSSEIDYKKEYYRRCKHEEGTFWVKSANVFIKLACLVRGNYVQNLMGDHTTMLPQYYEQYRRHNIDMLNQYVDKILAVSNRVRDIMIRQGVDPQKIVTSYIGTCFAQHQLGHSIASPKIPFTIAYLGYKRIDKGFFFLIDALSKLAPETASKIKVVLAVANVSVDDYQEKLKNFAEVVVHNGYTHEQLPFILKDVHLGIVPVLWEDNLPQIAIEMVACGVPVLCSSFGGASELCNSDLFKFAGGNEESLLERLRMFVEKPGLCQKYWRYHNGLTNMRKHVEELVNIYYL